jgi:mono/diheme cytochrome c family protein
MRTFFQVVVAVLAVAGLVAIAGGVAVIRGGFTARAKASAVERAVVGLVQDAAIASAGARELRSPVTATPAVLARARGHFARECAICHGNDGAGSPLGRAMFPPVPDLETSTHELTEGEIFHVVENGVRFSGMPAFGKPGDAEETQEHWELVAFIRHLPELLEHELEEMRALNPRSLEEWQAWKEKGGVVPKVGDDAHGGHGGHHGHH